MARASLSSSYWFFYFFFFNLLKGRARCSVFIEHPICFELESGNWAIRFVLPMWRLCTPQMNVISFNFHRHYGQKRKICCAGTTRWINITAIISQLELHASFLLQSHTITIVRRRSQESHAFTLNRNDCSISHPPPDKTHDSIHRKTSIHSPNWK